MNSRLPLKQLDNAYLLLAMATLFWGGNAIAGKLAAPHWQPFTLTLLRWLLVGLLVFPVALPHLKKDWSTIVANRAILCLLSAFSMALFNLLMYLALQSISAINASIEQASMPAMIMLANFVFLSQRINRLQLTGLLSSILGVVVICTNGDIGALFIQGISRGDGCMLLACAFYAAYTFGLRYKPDIHWLSFLWVLSVGCTAMSLPWAVWEWRTAGLTLPPAEDWLVVSYVVIFPTILSQLFYLRGVQLLGSNRAGLFINLVPVFGSLLAILLLGEQFRTHHFLGLLMVVGGIMLAERFAERTEKT